MKNGRDNDCCDFHSHERIGNRDRQDQWPGAFEIASGVYRSKGGKKSLKNVPSHTIHYGYIYDNEEMVDEVLVMAMRGPRTYTGEDTIEIDCHAVF